MELIPGIDLIFYLCDVQTNEKQLFHENIWGCSISAFEHEIKSFGGGSDVASLAGLYDTGVILEFSSALYPIVSLGKYILDFK